MPAVANPYDEVVYTTRARQATHPDALAVAARLVGLRPPPVTSCRVLELGCGTGGNLTPMAATLPGSRFVGVDYSAVQIDIARREARELGLSNVEFRAESILDLDESLGEFDFVICHGVYSWVPQPVRDKILGLCGRQLAPHGVAYVSYNTYPGWYRRAMARDAMGFHGKRAATPEDQVRSARAFLYFLAKNVPDQDEPYAKLLREEAELVAAESDYYVYHEHLESDNHPLYFRDFMAHATAAGLQYVGEVPPHRLLTGLPADVQETLRAMAPDLIHLEQYVDFLRNRSFRRSILCRADAALNRSPSPQVLRDCLVTGSVRPKSPEPDAASSAVEEFVSDEGTSVSTNDPIAKTALAELFRAWPKAVPVPALEAALAGRLGGRWSDDPDVGWRSLAQLLLDGHLNRLVMLHTHQPDYTAVPTERPVGFVVARHQAVTQPKVATVRHQEIPIPEFERAVLRLLDGTRDRAAVERRVAEAIEAGEVPPPQGDRPLADHVDLAFRQLAQAALLVA
jgi:methyltransferase-like protein/2-polyprenyl-3-methyl-5-hydroxy-6-metoxy-1,4-benzoquinol methylase